MSDDGISLGVLAQRIKRYRQERNLSQAELAGRAGFARSTLSKIENGSLSPTFEILLKIAQGFGMELSVLVRAEGAAGIAGRMAVTRGTTASLVADGPTRLSPLASQLKNPRFQSYIAEFTCADLDAFGPWNSHPTEDFLYVLSGTLVFHSEGYEKLHLAPGDSLHFDGMMPHACLTLPDEPCRCLYVFSEAPGT